MMKIIPRRKRARAAATGALPPVVAGTPARALRQASARELSAAAQEIAPLRSRIGGPDAASLEGQDVVLVIDPDAVAIAEGMAVALEGETALQQQKGVTPARLGGRLAQYRASRQLQASAEQLHRDIRDSRMVLRAVARRKRRRLMGAIDARLAQLPPGSKEHRRLQALAQQLKQAAARAEAARQALAKKTRAEGQAQAKELSALADKTQLAKTMRALRAGEEVDPAERETAAETFAAMIAPRATAPTATAPKGKRRPTRTTRR